MAAYKCNRCEGKGRISYFGHVQAGVCFKCKGSGAINRKPAAPSIKWAVFGIDRVTGERARLYNKSAKTAKAAVKLAITNFAKASAEFHEMFSLDESCAMAIRAAEIDRA